VKNSAPLYFGEYAALQWVKIILCFYISIVILFMLQDYCNPFWGKFILDDWHKKSAKDYRTGGFELLDR